MQVVVSYDGLRIFEVLFGVEIVEAGAPRRPSSVGRSVSFARPQQAKARLQDRDGRTIEVQFQKAQAVEEYSLDVSCTAAPDGVQVGILPELELRFWLLATFGNVTHGEDVLFPECGVEQIASYIRRSRTFLGLREEGQLLSFLELPRQGAVVFYLKETGMLQALVDAQLLSEAQRQALLTSADSSEFELTDGIARRSPLLEPVVQHDTLDDVPVEDCGFEILDSRSVDEPQPVAVIRRDEDGQVVVGPATGKERGPKITRRAPTRAPAMEQWVWADEVEEEK